MDSITILPIQWKICEAGGFGEADELHIWGLREGDSQPCLLRLLTFQNSTEFLYEITVAVPLEKRSNLQSMISAAIPSSVNHMSRETSLVNIYNYTKQPHYSRNVYLTSRRHVNSFIRNWQNNNWKDGIIFNEKIDYVRKFLTRLHLQPCQRITVTGASKREGNFKISTVQEYSLDIEKAKKCISASSSDVPVIPAVMSFDLEVYSENHNAFPDPERNANEIFMVSIIYQKFEEEPIKLLIVNGDCCDIPGVSVIRVDSERNLLHVFCQSIAHYNPDILTGYNIFTFDIPYLITRAKKCAFQWPNTFDRLLKKQVKLGSININTKRYPKFEMSGRIMFDLLKYVDFFHGKEFPSKTLDYVSEYFLNENKHDVSAREMFSIYSEQMHIKQALKNGLLETQSADKLLAINWKDAVPLFQSNVSPQVVQEVVRRWQKNLHDMSTVGDYCVQDSLLTSKLFKRLEIWLTMVEFSNILTIQPEKLFVTGQQIPSLGQIYELAYQQGFGIPTVHQKSNSYQGAYVLEPRIGVNDNVMCVDFNSMYPSIIRAFNICYSTRVRDEDIASMNPQDYMTITIQENGQDRNIYFIKPHIRMGILPQLSRNLIEQRKSVRRKITETKDPVTKISLDKRQLALKISANALYGMTGAGDKAMLPMNELARCVTGIGRRFLDKASEFLQHNYRAEIIYGDTDSVMFSCPDVTTGKQCMERGPQAAEEVSKIFPEPLRMEFEKAGRIFCITKKKYVYWKYGQDGNFLDRDKPGAYLDTGTAMKRRETPEFIRHMYRKIVDYILDFTPAPQIMQYILGEVKKLLSGQVPLQQLYITRTVTGTNYKNNNAEMSIYLRYLRENNMEPEVGEILRYIFIVSDKKYLGDKARPYERFRDGLIDGEIDYRQYLHMLSKKIDDVWRISQSNYIQCVLKINPGVHNLHNILNKPLETLEKELKKNDQLDNCYSYVLLLQLQ